MFSAEQQKIGDSVGYIQVAEAKLAECAKLKNLKELLDTFKFTMECIETKWVWIWLLIISTKIKN